MSGDHRDNLDRLTVAQYALDTNEVFTMDKLGNRTAVKEKSGGSTTYDVDNLNNRYTSIGASTQTYDKAGNLVKDKDGYGYEYDYENRITKVTKDQGQTTLVEFYYDALGRKIAKDVAGGAVTLYYYNPNWQLLSEYDLDSGQHQRSYVYGNYIDEVLMMREAAGDDYYYLHDHLYSPAALVDENGDVVERYEYDAYGKPGIMDGSYNNRTASSYANPYMFTGRTVDYLDSGSLKLQYNRNRYYDYPTGRWLTQDPRGLLISPSKYSSMRATAQYNDGLNLYETAKSSPLINVDPMGMMSNPCNKGSYGHWHCMCCMVFAEARGTNNICQQAVREVIYNRSQGRDGAKRRTICEVVAEGDGTQFNGYTTDAYKKCCTCAELAGPSSCCHETQPAYDNCIGQFPAQPASPLTNWAVWFHDTSINTPPWIERAIEEGRVEEVKVTGCASFRFYRLVPTGGAKP